MHPPFIYPEIPLLYSMDTPFHQEEADKVPGVKADTSYHHQLVERGRRNQGRLTGGSGVLLIFEEQIPALQEWNGKAAPGSRNSRSVKESSIGVSVPLLAPHPGLASVSSGKPESHSKANYFLINI